MIGQAQAVDNGSPGGQLGLIMDRRFRALLGRIHRPLFAVDNVAVERVFDIGGWIGAAKEAGTVGFIFGKEQFTPALGSTIIIT